MIVVDEDADRRLLKALEVLRSNPGSTRCLALKLANYPRLRLQTTQTHTQLLEAVRQATLPHTPQVFFCEDGDVFILAPFFATKEARLLMTQISILLDVPADQEVMEFTEIALSINPLLLRVEAKLEKQRLAIEAAKQRAEAQQAVRKRNAILNSPSDIKAHDIALMRISRKSPEIMIIEDDAFSRRLVENVLKKDFTLHVLADADLALATYARTAPDILFLDIDLPNVSGHELLEKIIELDPHSYVVMLSGNADRDNIMQAMNRGAKGFIGKPFTREKLFQTIERCPTIHKRKEGA